MKRRFESNSTWIAVVCVIGALLIAWIGLHVTHPRASRTTDRGYSGGDAH